MTEFAAIADKVVEAHYLPSTIAKVSLPPCPMPSTTSDALAGELQALRLAVKELSNEVRGLKAQPRSRPQCQQQPVPVQASLR